tara:strand:+ start:474 stop:656 length:183 start_codon:yes stop_codon:yes gene_type:complete
MNKKILSGLKKISIGMLLAFLGPIIFSTTNKIIGFISMILCFSFGLMGIRDIISFFFEKD